jgi:hypothetical protein
MEDTIKVLNTEAVEVECNENEVLACDSPSWPLTLWTLSF